MATKKTPTTTITKKEVSKKEILKLSDLTPDEIKYIQARVNKDWKR